MENQEPTTPTTAAAQTIDIADLPLRRAPIGWIMLLLIFGLYIGTTLIPERPKAIDPEERANPYLSEEISIRVGMRMRSVLMGLQQASASSTPKGIADKTQIDPDTIEELKADVNKDSRAARLYVAAKFEAGEAVSDKDIDPLRKSTSAGDRALVSIYQAKDLSKESAEVLTQDLPKNEFAYRLAKVHAYDKAGISGPRLQLAPVWKGALALAAMFIALFLVVVGIGLWIFYFVQRSMGKLAPLGHPTEPMTVPESDRFAYRAAIMMAIFLGINLVMALLVQALSIKGPAVLFILYGIVLVAAFAVHKFPAMGISIPLSRVVGSKRNFGKNVLLGLGAYLATLPILLIAISIAQFLARFFGQPSHPATELLQAGPSVMTVLALFFTAAIVAPLWEELMFRGTLMPAISRLLGRPLWGILISSFIFAAIHPQGVPLWLGLGSIGAVAGLITYQTKSLVPAIVMHSLNNGAVLTLGLILTS